MQWDGARDDAPGEGGGVQDEGGRGVSSVAREQESGRCAGRRGRRRPRPLWEWTPGPAQVRAAWPRRREAEPKFVWEGARSVPHVSRGVYLDRKQAARLSVSAHGGPPA